jgi:hypothetical protein
MFSKSGKHFANPAVGRMHDRGSVPEHSKETDKGGMPNDPNKGGDIEADHKGTTPHPVTGVHEVTISNHGGKAKTHVKHDGGHTEHNEHGSLGEAFAHAQSMMPDDAQAGGDSSGTPPVGGGMESAESLGGMMGGGGY